MLRMGRVGWTCNFPGSPAEPPAAPDGDALVMANDETRPARRGRRDQATTRYGQVGGSGANEPKHGERKEEGGWVSRQGGDQTRGPDADRERREKHVDR